MTNPLTTAEATVTISDLTPIVRLVLEPAVVAVKADSPYKNMKDFIEAARKNPGQLKQSGGSVTGRDNLVFSFSETYLLARPCVMLTAWLENRLVPN